MVKSWGGIKITLDQATLRKLIEQLRQEQQEITYALWALEAVASGKPRRGRPPKTSTRRPAKGLPPKRSQTQ